MLNDIHLLMDVRNLFYCLIKDKKMKKLTIMMTLLLWVFVMLTACGTDTNENDDLSNNDSDVAGSQEDVSVEVSDRNEYQFKFTLKNEDGLGMSSKMYKKWDNSLIEFIELADAESDSMPFVPKKSLMVDGTIYQQIEKDGELIRFSIPGMDMESDTFNLKEMSTIDESMVSDTKKENINGKKMTCYYVNDSVEGEGKSCLYDGVFAYGEFSNSGILNTIEITDYKDDVKNSVFDLPDEDDILSTQDMGKLFQ